MGVSYLNYRVAQWLTTTLPTAAAFGFAERLADVQWRWSTTDRRAVQANLSRILGTPPPASSPMVREVFRHFGRYLVEFFTMHEVKDPGIRLEGDEHLARALRAGRGAIALTAHLGNWELAAVTVRRMGIPLTAVALPHQDPRMDRLFNQQRQRCGVDVIPLGPDAAQLSLRLLRRGSVLGLLGDREFTQHGIAVPVGNGQLLLPSGPAILSLRSQAPMVPLFLLREGVWKFRFCIEPPIWPSARGSTTASIRQLTGTYAAVLERYLKRFPDQWLMFRPI